MTTEVAHWRLVAAVLVKRLGEKQTITEEDWSELKQHVAEHWDGENLVIELEANGAP